MADGNVNQYKPTPWKAGGVAPFLTSEATECACRCWRCSSAGGRGGWEGGVMKGWMGRREYLSSIGPGV